MNHEESGIKRKVSEAVYPQDVLSELTLIFAPPDVKGAWVWCLFIMWNTNTDRIAGTFEEIGRLWGCSSDEARRLCEEIKRREIATVTLCPENVTLMSRRLNRRLKAKEQARKRKQKQREKECHAPVTEKKVLPSSSSSSSSSSSGAKEAPHPPKGGGRPKSFKQWTGADFRDSIREANHDGLLTGPEGNDFFSYWTEKSASGQFKFAMQKTWDTRRRMQTALRRIYQEQREKSGFQAVKKSREESDTKRRDSDVQTLAELIRDGCVIPGGLEKCRGEVLRDHGREAIEEAERIAAQ